MTKHAVKTSRAKVINWSFGASDGKGSSLPATTDTLASISAARGKALIVKSAGNAGGYFKTFTVGTASKNIIRSKYRNFIWWELWMRRNDASQNGQINQEMVASKVAVKEDAPVKTNTCTTS